MTHTADNTDRQENAMTERIWSKTWRRPRLTTFIAAAPNRWRIIRNRYGSSDSQSVTIGLMAQFGRRAVSVTWAWPVVTKVGGTTTSSEEQTHG